MLAQTVVVCSSQAPASNRFITPTSAHDVQDYLSFVFIPVNLGFPLKYFSTPVEDLKYFSTPRDYHSE